MDGKNPHDNQRKMTTQLSKYLGIASKKTAQIRTVEKPQIKAVVVRCHKDQGLTNSINQDLDVVQDRKQKPHTGQNTRSKTFAINQGFKSAEKQNPLR